MACWLQSIDWQTASTNDPTNPDSAKSQSSPSPFQSGLLAVTLNPSWNLSYSFVLNRDTITLIFFSEKFCAVRGNYAQS